MEAHDHASSDRSWRRLAWQRLHSGIPSACAPHSALAARAADSGRARAASAWIRGAGERADAAVDRLRCRSGAPAGPVSHSRGDRAARCGAQAGGLRADADPGGVNLAARAADGDEMYVPASAKPACSRTVRLRTARPFDAKRTAQRAVLDDGECRRQHRRCSRVSRGSRDRRERSLRASSNCARSTDAFRQLDELLDVAGMTQTRLERARPYLLHRNR